MTYIKKLILSLFTPTPFVALRFARFGSAETMPRKVWGFILTFIFLAFLFSFNFTLAQEERETTGETVTIIEEETTTTAAGTTDTEKGFFQRLTDRINTYTGSPGTTEPTTPSPREPRPTIVTTTPFAGNCRTKYEELRKSAKISIDQMKARAWLLLCLRGKARI